MRSGAHHRLADAVSAVRTPNTSLWFAGTRILVTVNAGNECPELEHAGWEVAVDGATDRSGVWVYEAMLSDTKIGDLLRAVTRISAVQLPDMVARPIAVDPYGFFSLE